MVTSTEKTRLAAQQLSSLIEEHMDEAGLTVAQREANVLALEIATARILDAFRIKAWLHRVKGFGKFGLRTSVQVPFQQSD